MISIILEEKIGLFHNLHNMEQPLNKSGAFNFHIKLS